MMMLPLDSISLVFVVSVIVAIVIGASGIFLYFSGGKLWTFLRRSLFRKTRESSSRSPSTFPDEPAPAESGKIGLAVVIANEYEGKNRLVGTAKDKELWEETFKELNFDVRTSRGVGLNSSKEEMLRLIDLLHQIPLWGIDVRNYRHIAFVFSGHGYDGGIYSQHEERLDFKKEVFPRIFHDKRDTFNKLIFIDACRNSIDDGKGQKSLKISSEMIPKSCDGDGVSVGVGAFIAYATLSGRSVPDSRDGSYFSRCATKYLQEDLTLSVVMDKAADEIREMSKNHYTLPERISLLSGGVNLYRDARRLTDGQEEGERDKTNSSILSREPPSTDPGGNKVRGQDASSDPNSGASPTSNTVPTDTVSNVTSSSQPHHSHSSPLPNAVNSEPNVSSDELPPLVTPRVDVTPHANFMAGRGCDEHKVISPSNDVMEEPRMTRSIQHTHANVVGHEPREGRSEEFTDPNILTIKSLMPYLPELASLGLRLSGWLDMGSAWAAIAKTPGTPQDHVQKLLTEWLSDEEDSDIPHTWTHFIEVVRDCNRGKLAERMEREILGIEVKPQVSQSAPPTVQRPLQVPDSILDSRPTEPDINKLVGSRMSAEWDRLAMYLIFDANTRQAIDRDNSGKCGRCFSDVVISWLEGKEGTGDLPRTWRSVLQAVRDCGHRGLVDDVSRALSGY